MFESSNGSSVPTGTKFCSFFNKSTTRPPGRLATASSTSSRLYVVRELPQYTCHDCFVNRILKNTPASTATCAKPAHQRIPNFARTLYNQLNGVQSLRQCHPGSRNILRSSEELRVQCLHVEWFQWSLSVGVSYEGTGHSNSTT